MLIRRLAKSEKFVTKLRKTDLVNSYWFWPHVATWSVNQSCCNRKGNFQITFLKQNNQLLKPIWQLIARIRVTLISENQYKWVKETSIKDINIKYSFKGISLMKNKHILKTNYGKNDIYSRPILVKVTYSFLLN